ncbi:MAG: hypothetical protein WDN28_32080 [Chthoniobacter sp.]
MPFPVLASLRTRCGAIALASSLFAAGALAGTPRVSHIYPGGAQRGAEMEITCFGSNLDDTRTFLFDEPASFESQILTAEKGKFTAKIKVAPDARLGEHTCGSSPTPASPTSAPSTSRPSRWSPRRIPRCARNPRSTSS